MMGSIVGNIKLPTILSIAVGMMVMVFENY